MNIGTLNTLSSSAKPTTRGSSRVGGDERETRVRPDGAPAEATKTSSLAAGGPKPGLKTETNPKKVEPAKTPAKERFAELLDHDDVENDTDLRKAPAVDLAPKAKGTSAPALAVAANADTSDHRAAWTEFLRRMKDDLNVSGEDVLKAFTKLSDEDLAKPPAETVNQLVMALNLAPPQAALAKLNFTQLIKDTGAGAALKSDTVKTEAGKEAEALSSLERMNQDFFMKRVQTPSVKDDARQTPPIADVDVDGELEASAEATASEPMAGAEPFEAKHSSEKPASGGVVGTTAAKAAPKAINKLVDMMERVDQPVADRVVQRLVNAATDKQNEIKQKFSAPTATAETAGEAARPQFRAAPLAPPANARPLAALNEDDESTDNAADGETPFEAMMSGGGDAAANAGEANAPKDFAAKLSTPKNDGPVTIPELMKNAKIMIKEGGGEMKVTMHPEGLGQVAMRVSVEHGKVNVTMITQTDEAKHLLERQVGELKSSLNNSHLQTGEIKIDTAGNLKASLEQQYQDAHRQQTQGNWEQFRQENQGWRRGFTDTGSARAYKGSGQATRDNGLQANRARAVDGSRRLDLVA